MESQVAENKSNTSMMNQMPLQIEFLLGIIKAFDVSFRKKLNR